MIIMIIIIMMMIIARRLAVYRDAMAAAGRSRGIGFTVAAEEEQTNGIRNPNPKHLVDWCF